MVKFPASTPSQGLQLSAATEAQLFDWHTCWYPILFSVDLPSDRPYGFSIYGEPMVLFRDQEGELICLRDRCPHRLAKLSDGQVIDGRLETVCKKKIKNREITTKTSKGQIKPHFSSNEVTK